MSIEEFCTQLTGKLAAAAPDTKVETAAVEIGGYFGVQPHEVAFFVVNPTRHVLEFRWPRLASGGDIPLKSFNSTVAQTANERRAFIDNTFAATPHLYIFEHFLINRDERIPVQKVMSVPFMAGTTVLGVIQVARKGATPEDAGADFTDADLASLERMAPVIAAIG